MPSKAPGPSDSMESTSLLYTALLQCHAHTPTAGNFGTIYCHPQAWVRNSRTAKGRNDPRAQHPKDCGKPRVPFRALPSYWVTHLCVVTVYIVQHMSEDVRGDVMQGDYWEVPRGCRLLALLKVVIQQGSEVVAAAAEESLREVSSESTRAEICPRGN